MAKKLQKKRKRTAIKSKLERSEKSKKEVKLNPFDIRMNREHHSVLGQKSKHDRGMPGVSRSRAIKMRAEMLVKHQVRTGKSNCYIDKRFGVNDPTIDKEDQMLARRAYERRKRQKTSIFNLNDDDDELTHGGKPINEFDKFDDPISDSDGDDDMLNADYVKEAHFGGFLVEKPAEFGPPKTHKDLINDLIFESKIKKQEKKKEREEITDLTEKLDEVWKKNCLVALSSKINKPIETTAKKDDFDRIVKELRDEPHGTASSRLKTPEELEKEEEEKLQKLEQERLLRMQGPVEKHLADNLSPDSIYDGFEIEDLVSPSNAADDSSDILDGDDGDTSLQIDGDDGDTSLQIDGDAVTDSDSEDESEKEYEDMYSDLDSGSEEDESMNVNELSDEASVPMNSENKNLPEIFVGCPNSVNELLVLTLNSSAEEQSVIVGRIIECNHPRLLADNRGKMELFFKVLLEYSDYLCCNEIVNSTAIINALVPHIYLLAQLSPGNTASIFRNVLLEKEAKFRSQRKCASSKSTTPCLDSLVILKLCSILYSTSDFWHPVVIVAMLFMSEILTEKFAVTYHNVLCRLFICHLFYEYVSLSKRFVPESISFLKGVIFMACVKDSESMKLFKGKYLEADKNLLLVTSPIANEQHKINISIFCGKSLESSDALKMNAISIAVEQLICFAELYCSLPSFPELFSPVCMLCEKLPIEYYSCSLVSSIKKFQDYTKTRAINRSHLTYPMKKPVPLKLFEPAFECAFSGQGKKENIAKKLKIQKTLSQKCRKEERRIEREVRRDTQFLAHEQLKRISEDDKYRKRKVKELYRDISMQQADYNALCKEKSKEIRKMAKAKGST